MTQANAVQVPKTKTVEISVNFKTVVMPDHKATGLSIKQTAIAQGVNIKPDFVLYEVKDGNRRHRVPDDKEISLHPGDKFEAVPDDDNS